MINQTFDQLQDLKYLVHDRGHCGPLAIAITANLPYDIVRQHVVLEGLYKPRSGGMLVSNMIKALQDFGFTVKLRSVKHETGANRTPRTIGRYYPTGRYIAITSTHALALVNGKVEDWTRERKHKIYELIELG